MIAENRKPANAGFPMPDAKITQSAARHSWALAMVVTLVVAHRWSRYDPPFFCSAW
jgi:hypothetical protein